MNTIFKISAVLVLFLCILFLPNEAQAQFQINLTGSHISSAESGGTFTNGSWGGGATLRYFISPQLAVGVNGRYFTRNDHQEFDGGLSGKSRSNFITATAEVDYFLTKSALRPYVGVEAGLYQSTFDVHITNSTAISDLGKYVDNNFGVGPKVGLQYGIGPSFGISVDAGYHFIFYQSNPSNTILLGAGLFYTFGRKY